MDDARATAAQIALGMYVGETCRYCRHTYTSVEDLKERGVVWARLSSEPSIKRLGHSLACKSCFTERHGSLDQQRGDEA
jgi:hypothetical protein